jgi:hypothetical protein
VVIFRFLLISSCFLASTASRAESDVLIQWNSVNKSLGITARETTLMRVLGEIRRQTGWDVLVEPGLNPLVSIRIKTKPAPQTLRLLLGKLQYTLKSEPGHPFRLNVFRKSENAATEPVVEAPGASKRLEGQIAVGVKNEAHAKRLAKRFGAELIGFIKAANAARFKFPSEKELQRIRDELAKAEGVEYVDDIIIYPRPARPARVPARSGVVPIRIRPVEVDTKGQFIIGLVDSAVQPKGLDKPGFVLETLTVGEPYEPGPGSPTHGTAMASIILRGLSNEDLEVQTSPVRILPVDVFGPNSTTTSFDVAQGITLAVEGGAKIVNLSLGGSSPSTLVKKVIQVHHDNGVLFIAAAGNEPVTANTFPAAYSQVLAVTATRPNGELTSYANRGNFVDVAERGTQPVRYQNQIFAGGGTSSATAYISGVAAALATQHRKKPVQIRETIIKNRPFVPPKKEGK